MIMLLAACGSNPGKTGLDRINAWQTVERYKIDQRIANQRVSEWIREPGNEAKAREDAIRTLGLETPDALPAVESALTIAIANPVDDLGFMALRFAFYELRNIDQAVRSNYEDTVFELLETHYIHDMRLDRILLGIIRFGGDRGVDLVDEVVARSNLRQLRGRGAYWSASERLKDVDDLSKSADERAQIRAEVMHMANLVASEYADVTVFRGQPGGEAIQPVLYVLDNLAIGQTIPDANAQRIGGDQESLSQYRGNVLLLDFWATWCVPCIASLPDIERLSETLGDLDFQVITISIDEAVELVEEFMESRVDLPYINWYVGSESRLYNDWSIQGVPTYIVVDRDGTVLGKSMELEPLYKVILEYTGADLEAKVGYSW
jgi:thiol-disulfide isomerase/thioredoxin